MNKRKITGLNKRRLSSIFIFCVVLTASLLCRTEIVEAVANPLDVSFGSGGKVVYDIGANSTSNSDLDVQPDGKIVVVGTASSTSPDLFTVSRYTANGVPDTSFSGDGVIADTFSVSTQYSRASTMAIQPDGKIIVAGLGFLGAKTAFGIARLNPDGSYDATFDGDGKANIAVSEFDSGATDVALQPDGKIVITGYVSPNQVNYFPAIARLNPNGSLDTTFSDDGIISYQNVIFGVATQVFVEPSGKIRLIISGNLGQNNLMIRYNTDGTADTTFGNNGRIEGFPSGAVVFQPDGKILIGTTYVYFSNISSDFIVYRLNADGGRDNSFGAGGEMLISFGDAVDNLGAIKLQPDGKIIAAGTRFTGSPTSNTGDFAVARLNANGSLDTTFGTGGKVITPVEPANDLPVAIALQSNGKIVVAGNATRPNNANFKRGVLVTYMGDLNTADFDGDTKTDISVFRPADGAWYLLRSRDGFAAAQFGNATDKIAPGDYDGDGKTDLAVFRNGAWYILQSGNGVFKAVNFGQNGDFPVAADYDGDGRTDVAVFRQGAWYLIDSSTNQLRAVQFGIATDKPVPSDYDGDGRTDIAVFRDGNWYSLRSLDGGFTAVSFGAMGDRPVPSDYDGDGRSDPAVFRGGVWYLQRSTAGFTGFQFGSAGDIPAAADYDGDGKADAAVYRSGAWYRVNSSDGAFSATQFGIDGDVPAPSALFP